MKLTELGVRAFHYHAGMTAEDRSDVQKKWQNNQYHVIVATIAFGMGIDKADVRYVIHHTMPKSLEGYYQETGRAGRDGKRSECYLYYQFADTRMLRKMIDDGEGSREQKQRLHDMLRTVIQYCENKADCRRAQVLGYFSEAFDPANCNKTCDNCRSDASFVTKDLTDYAAMAFKLVSKVHEDNVTMHQCVDAFRGAKSAKIKKSGLERYGWGYGADLERGDNERIFQSLLESRALKEESIVNKVGFATNYLHVSDCAPFVTVTTDYCSPLLSEMTTRPSASSLSCRFEHHRLRRQSRRSRPRNNRRTILRRTFPRPFERRSGRSKTMLTNSKILIAITIISRSHGMPRVTRRVAVDKLRTLMTSSLLCELRSRHEPPNSLGG